MQQGSASIFEVASSNGLAHELGDGYVEVLQRCWLGYSTGSAVSFQISKDGSLLQRDERDEEGLDVFAWKLKKHTRSHFVFWPGWIITVQAYAKAGRVSQDELHFQTHCRVSRLAFESSALRGLTGFQHFPSVSTTFFFPGSEWREKMSGHMRCDDANSEDDDVRSVRTQPSLLLTQGHSPVQKSSSVHFGTGNGSEVNANVASGHEVRSKRFRDRWREGESSYRTAKAILRDIGGDFVTFWLRLQSVWWRVAWQEGDCVGPRTWQGADDGTEVGRRRAERVSPSLSFRRSVASERTTAHPLTSSTSVRETERAPHALGDGQTSVQYTLKPSNATCISV